MGNCASLAEEAPAAPSHLTYFARRSVIEHFSIGKRRELVKKIPSLRRVNAKIPFHFDKVSLSYANYTYRMKLDDVEWILKKEESRIGTVKTVVNWKPIAVKYNRLVDNDWCKLMDFYLNANGRIKELCLSHISDLPNQMVIGQLEMQFQPSLNDNLIEEIMKKQINHVVLESTEGTPDDFYEKLTVRKLGITETSTTLEKFQKMCWKLKEGGLHVKGSYYKAEYEAFEPVFWEYLKEELHVEMCHDDYFTSKLDDKNLELLVTRKPVYNRRNSCWLRAEIVDYGTGLNMKDWKISNLDRDYRHSLYLILIVYPLVIRNIKPITAFCSQSISTSTLSDYLSNSPRFLFIGHETYCQFQNLYLEWTARPRKTRLELTIATAFVPAFLITYSYLNITISEIISSLLKFFIFSGRL